MATISWKIIIQQNSQLPASQRLGLHFSECERNWNVIMSNYKNGHHFAANCHTTKFLISDPQVLLFQVSTETEYWHQALWKMGKWLPFAENHCTAKFPIADSPKCWISAFLCLDRNWILASAIMIKWINGCHFMKSHHTAKFSITNTLKFGSPLFWVAMEMDYWHQLLWKKWKNGCHFAENCHTAKLLHITD